jgi:hypothetical protein
MRGASLQSRSAPVDQLLQRRDETDPVACADQLDGGPFAHSLAARFIVVSRVAVVTERQGQVHRALGRGGASRGSWIPIEARTLLAMPHVRFTTVNQSLAFSSPLKGRRVDRTALLLGVFSSLVLLACSHGPCQTAQEEGPLVSGTVSAEGPDGGASPDASLEYLFPALSLSDSADSLTAFYGLVLPDGLVHGYHLHIDGLRPGTAVDLGSHGQICVDTMPLNPQPGTPGFTQPEGPSQCCPMVGSLVVRAVSSMGSGCAEPDQCAQSIDATLTGTSMCIGAMLVFNLVLSETGTFVPEPCPKAEIP